jgi:hypothetical protein
MNCEIAHRYGKKFILAPMKSVTGLRHAGELVMVKAMARPCHRYRQEASWDGSSRDNMMFFTMCMDEAMRAGTAVMVCSAVILGIVSFAMLTMAVGIG